MALEKTKNRSTRRRCLALLALSVGLTPYLIGTARAEEPALPPRLTVMLEESPPYSFADAQGRPAGYSVELARELMARAHVEGSFEFSSWSRVLLRGRSEANVLLPAIVRLPEREAHYHWLGQIGTRRGTLYRLKSRAAEVQVKSIADARAYRIGVIRDDVSERELAALGLELGTTLDRSADYAALLRRFFAGRDELVALNQALAPAILRQYGYDPALVEPVLRFSESKPSMALSLQTPDALRQKLRETWEAMRKDGTLAAIAARYPMVTLE